MRNLSLNGVFFSFCPVLFSIGSFICFVRSGCFLKGLFFIYQENWIIFVLVEFFTFFVLLVEVFFEPIDCLCYLGNQDDLFYSVSQLSYLMKNQKKTNYWRNYLKNHWSLMILFFWFFFIQLVLDFQSLSAQVIFFSLQVSIFLNLPPLIFANL